MTNQEIFNKVWNHFIVEEGVVSASQSGCPVYRDGKGNKCVFGLLIPDELYKPAMEGLSLDSILCRWPAVMVAVLGDNSESNTVEMLYNLAEVHDDAAWDFNPSLNSCYSKAALVDIAEEFNLSIPLRSL
jgi:hypothetical protein